MKFSHTEWRREEPGFKSGYQISHLVVIQFIFLATHPSPFVPVCIFKQFKAWVRNVQCNYGWAAISLVVFVLPG